MIKDTIKFGVEIEYKDAVASSVKKALKEAGIQSTVEGYHTSRDFSVWKISYDGTVSRGSGYGMRGGELVSPVLTVDRISEIETVVNAVKSVGGTVNINCGIHVHISWDNMDSKTVRNIIRRYKKYETQIDSMMPSSRRGSNNSYCRSLVNISDRIIDEARLYNLTDRQMKVNTTGLSEYGRVQTIEFRHHSGTLSYFKIKNWILFLIDFVNQSDNLKKSTEKTFVSDRDVPSETKRKAWGVLKFAMEKFDIEMTQKRGFGFAFKSWKETINGNTSTRTPYLKSMTYDEVCAMYIGESKKLDDEKLYDFLSEMLGVTFDSDSLFAGVCEKLEYYFMGRSDLLNN